jgi:uncharacterized membrane protein
LTTDGIFGLLQLLLVTTVTDKVIQYLRRNNSAQAINTDVMHNAARTE